jgi:hypothetical protein
VLFLCHFVVGSLVFEPQHPQEKHPGGYPQIYNFCDPVASNDPLRVHPGVRLIACVVHYQCNAKFQEMNFRIQLLISSTPIPVDTIFL